MLEDLIVRYQNSIKDGRPVEQEELFERICEMYQPLSYIPKWYPKYQHLCDSEDDFKQDFMRVFCATLVAWKPRHERKASRYGGKGDFKNFFWGALSHSYINGVKSEAAGKRNIPQMCPICNEWCQPLSTHVLEKHVHLMWDKLKSLGYDITTMTKCPLCKSYKPPKTDVDPSEHLRRHLVSMHSSLIFEHFHELHPDYVTVSAKPMSVYGDGSDGEEVSAYDTTTATPGIDALLTQNLTPLQRRLVENILNGATSLKYSPSYDCTEDEFLDAVEGLQDALVVSGIGETHV